METFYTTERLLGFALRMLDQARQEQLAPRRDKRKWLTDNSTLETIRARVGEIEAAAAKE